MTPDQSRAIARLAQTLTGDDYTKLQGLLRAGAHLAEYPSAWQEYVAARVGNVLKYSESQARDDRGRWTSSGYPTWDDLSEPQQQALTTYQTSGYKAMNGYARTGNPMEHLWNEGIGSKEELQKHVDTLDNLVKTVPPLAQDTTLYRGVSGKLSSELRSLQPGDSFTDKGFSSTSYDQDVAKQFGIWGLVVVINAPKGTKALDIDKLFDEPSESEVLLPRNTKFTVDSVKGNEVFVSVKNG